MNSGSLDKNRTQVVKKVVCLFVLVLVALAYLMTSSIAFASNGEKFDTGNSSGYHAIITALEKGTEKFSNLLKFANCEQGRLINITFPNDPGVPSLEAECLGNNEVLVNIALPKLSLPKLSLPKLSLPKPSLPNPPTPDLSKIQEVLLKMKNDGSGIVRLVHTLATNTMASGTGQTFPEFQGCTPSDWQLFSPMRTPLNMSAITKAGQMFLIRRVGKSTFLPAQFLGKGNVGYNQVLVTLPDQTLLTKPLSEF